MVEISNEVTNQLVLTVTIVVLLAFFIWNKYRYDAISVAALIFLVTISSIPDLEVNIINIDQAFYGFANPAVMTVALVLIISQGLKNAGLSALAGKVLAGRKYTEIQFLLFLMLIAATLSSFINNIGAMAILLPLTVSVCQKMEWHPAKFLMPLAFACILGGMNTLIGTPPNIIISDYAYQQTGSGFNFFDFSKVGILITISGILFVAFIGNKLLRLRVIPNNEPLINMKGYMFEVQVNKGSSSIGLTLFKFKKQAGEDIEIMGVISETGSIKKVKNNMRIKEGQILVIKSPPDEIGKILNLFDFSIPEDLHSFDEADLEEIEVLISPGSRLIGRNYDYFQKLAFEELNLLGLWRKGTKYRTRLTREAFKAGDVLLLGVRELDDEEVKSKIKHLGLMPIREREIEVVSSRSRLLKGIIFFLSSILFVAFEVLSPTIAFLLCVLCFARIKIINSNFYKSVEWPIIVMLAAMIPIGLAIQTTGLSSLIALNITELAPNLNQAWILIIILIITMIVSDIINNAATAVIMAPISYEIAINFGYDVNAFLMVVAVGASCAFLTPIGHQCNTVVMGPGNYKFTDYWRMGLPLEILIIAVAIPMILFVWA
tara:strand:- start:1536 stop:3344 length:1809 start_codon:yes stop_codon:yes gene_type:complete